nr:MAG TPA: hypothetical protein [Caudoviricetes sp.]
MLLFFCCSPVLSPAPGSRPGERFELVRISYKLPHLDILTVLLARKHGY